MFFAQNNRACDFESWSESVTVQATATTLPNTLPEEYSIVMTVDNTFDLYVGGSYVGSGNNWKEQYTFTPFITRGVDVICIDGVDVGGPAAFLGAFGGLPSKASDWKCKRVDSGAIPTGWTLNTFDDSSWVSGVGYSQNNDVTNIWNRVSGRNSQPGIPLDAEWVWTTDNENSNRVLCRFKPAPVWKVTSTTVSIELNNVNEPPVVNGVSLELIEGSRYLATSVNMGKYKEVKTYSLTMTDEDIDSIPGATWSIT